MGISHLGSYNSLEMDSQKDNFAVSRRRMVDTQLRGRGIFDPAVLGAFAEVPREMFVPPEQIDEVYGDHPVPIGAGQTISQPYIVAIMVQELAVKPGHRILDIGAGRGYQTAILAKLAGHVYAIERIDSLAKQACGTLARLNIDNVTLCVDDGSGGWPEEAPFDGIICGAAAPEIPQSWTHQLADGGRIVAPTGGENSQILSVLEKHGDKLTRRDICDVRFVKLIGKHGWPR